jgi:hypothetical protein
VPTLPSDRSILALAALEEFPPSIRESLISNTDFRTTYGLKADAKISIGGDGVSFTRSTLFDCIRKVLADSQDRSGLKDDAGEEWWLDLIDVDNERRIVLTRGEQRMLLPGFPGLSPNQAQRLKTFDDDANDVNLPNQSASAWRQILAKRGLADDELDALREELRETPIRVASMISSEMKTGKGNLSTLVPCSAQYFDRLVGEYRKSENVADYAHGGATEHIRQLLSWRSYEGFLLSLLLSSHSSLSSALAAEIHEEDSLSRVYEWLLSRGDRISQIGAIEIGLSILDKRRDLAPYVQRIIEEIRDDNPEGSLSRFHLLSSLITLVEGELSRTKILRDKPPFWRRLASIAQASLIERCIITSQIDIAQFTEWAAHARLQQFYLQNLADLRLEPRWVPDYIDPSQLKAEFIGRILNAARQNAAKIGTPELQHLLLSEGPNSLQSIVDFPFPYLPGPLEGGLESRIDPPGQLLSAIDEQLSAEVLTPSSFAALVNSALVFRLESRHAKLAATALRSVRNQLRHVNSKDQLFNVARGVAIVAAVTRSGELAEELRILIRRSRYIAEAGLSTLESTVTGFVAAAAYPGLMQWCEFVGEWITELAFSSLSDAERVRLRSDIDLVCSIVPELWCTCGRAHAALSAAPGAETV